MGTYYVVRGAKMRCSNGCNIRKINLPVSHGSYVKGKPILNKTDCKTENISYFGVCPECTEAEEITVIDENKALKTGKKCTPVIVVDWSKAKEDNLVEGQPAITNESIIFCTHGGKITFVDSGQE